MSSAGKGLAVAVFLLFTVFNDAFAQRINFSFSSLTGTQSPLWVAKEAGFFKQHGLDARLVYIPGGSVVVQAMHSGELQFGVSGPAAVIRGNLGGADFAFVAVGSNKIDFVLVTAKHITNVQDLKGKRVGVGRFGGGPDYSSRIVFEKLGLKPEKDINLLQTLGGQPTRLAILQSGAMEGVVITPPFTLQAKQLGFNLLLEYSKIIPNYFSSGFIATRKYIRENPQIVENTVKSLMDAMRYVFSNEGGTMKIVGRYMKITDEAFLRSYYREALLGQINRTLQPDPKAIEFILEEERKTNPAAERVKPEDFIDARFLDKLR
jgi:NitT/TauT family transport system substrate-binding protein